MKVTKKSEDEPETQDIDDTQLGAWFPRKGIESVVLGRARTGDNTQYETKSWDRVHGRVTNGSPAQRIFPGPEAL